MNARVAAALLVALALPARAQFVQPEGSHFHNGSTLPLEDDGRAAALLQKLVEAADRGAVDEAPGLFDQLRALPGPELVPFGPRLYVPALERAARQLLEPGHAALAKAVLASERAAVAQAAHDRDLPALLDRAARGVSLATAPRAALLAARLLFEEGRFAEAAGLAARAAGEPGADELLAAARRRLPPPPSPPAEGPNGWLAENAGALARPSTSDTLPFVGSLPRGRLLFTDGTALHVIDRATHTRVVPPFDRFVSGAGAKPSMLDPASARIATASVGGRWVLPLDAIDFASYQRVAQLGAVDIGDDVRLAWLVEPAAGDASGSVCGPPLIFGQCVYVQVFRIEADTSVSLDCFDLSDGRLLWETPLASAGQVQPFVVRFQTNQPDERPCELAPAERDGLLWCCTGYGVIAAVDALTGVPQFAFRYDRATPEDIATFDPAFLWETGSWDDEPIRFHADRVLIAPPDSRYLYLLAERPGPKGQLVLDDPIEKLDRTFVVALRDDPQGRPSPALLCTHRSHGRDGLVLLGPDGHVLQAGPPLPEGRTLLGRPLALGDRVLLPTSGGLLDASATDFAAAPRQVVAMPGVPAAIQAVYPLDVGIATVSLATTAGPAGFWVLQWYAPAP